MCVAVCAYLSGFDRGRDRDGERALINSIVLPSKYYLYLVYHQAVYFTKKSYPKPDTELTDQVGVLQIALTHNDRQQRITSIHQPFDLFLPYDGINNVRKTLLALKSDQIDVIEIVPTALSRDIHLIMKAQQANVETPQTSFVSMTIFYKSSMSHVMDVRIPIR